MNLINELNQILETIINVKNTDGINLKKGDKFYYRKDDVVLTVQEIKDISGTKYAVVKSENGEVLKLPVAMFNSSYDFLVPYEQWKKEWERKVRAFVNSMKGKMNDNQLKELERQLLSRIK